MRLEHIKTRRQREDEAVTPPARLHGRSLTREVSRQLGIEGEDDRLFAWEVAVQQSNADVRFLGDVSKRRPVVSALSDQGHCCGVQPVSRLGALSRLARRPAPF